ncbi:cyclophilin-like fold protein [Plebeiibacterium sediminum]|uniref:Cyclophilin-like fold protein n=1 Tax=Plebeiibacterium sediminum TaxID=2992112 RepID=A0AAE3SGH1_9BACT|nr:cyclophilin-like fold protein [Plebeiobacterium sediminum]MCW3787293.1 cyclophilin-like fold protein [Plebeiobacterium sediminum]
MYSLRTLLFIIITNCIALNAYSQGSKIKITVDQSTVLTATLVDNSSVTALIELLKDGVLTIEMSDYGNMEKVGPIGTTLPRNDEQITTQPGDIILYQGSALVIYYAPNSWNFTRLGKIDNVFQNELKSILGTRDVSVKLELINEPTSIGKIQDRNDPYIVYQNPVNDILKISGEFEFIALMDANGREILRTKDDKIDISGFNSGVYLVQIHDKNKPVIIKKIIKE